MQSKHVFHVPNFMDLTAGILHRALQADYIAVIVSAYYPFFLMIVVVNVDVVDTIIGAGIGALWELLIADTVYLDGSPALYGSKEGLFVQCIEYSCPCCEAIIIVTQTLCEPVWQFLAL